jgi:hypothetical protein
VKSQIDTLGIASIQDINALPGEIRTAFYARLVPDELYARFGVGRHGPGDPRRERLIQVTAPPDKPWARVEVRASHEDRDPILLVDVEMSGSDSVPELAFVQINDPASTRYAIDRDPEGQDTLYGTVSRNLEEEARALADGLAPGQVRRGLRLLRSVLRSMDDFCRVLGKEIYLVEPLFYHSAILYERGGCGYLMGREQMEEIHRGFAADGPFTRRLDGSTPFRQPGFETSVRGRSWAITDGILGAPFGGVKMYKAPGRSAGVSTFPDGVY